MHKPLSRRKAGSGNADDVEAEPDGYRLNQREVSF
ncbi:hypothetical protein MED297_15430 [Reinekea sp. MED297]|uniref:Uncharacterized protein n=1 Tax=Reinekea blandensis MED297 TaxID=314283 RepID=A4BJ01_9GAMM|nr:hypothetical protein MED297_15430 [Reinekea sp. MED297] [Reinekea blandensis MED297]